MRIAAGALRERVALMEPVQGTDVHGAPVTRWEQAATRPARRLRYRGLAEEREAQRQGVASVDFLLRLDTDTRRVTTEWRIEHDGAQYLVGSVDRRPEDGSIVISGVAPQE